MKLYYYKRDLGNFGDDLNPWLWSKLIPNILDDNDDTLFVGIGTLLNHRIPIAPNKIIFGSGYGYGEKPQIDERWKFICVRGPLTAGALGLDVSLAITDPAALVSVLTLAAPTKDGGIAFMPHYSSGEIVEWSKICEILGIRLIDPCWDVDRVLTEVARSSVLIAEAMHGAIIADTLRVPWVPVVCHDDVLEFKWMDWCASLDMRYQPEILPFVYDSERDCGLQTKLKNKIKRGLLNLGWASSSWTPPPQAKSSQVEFNALIDRFGMLISKLNPQLSEDKAFYGAVELLQDRLDCFVRQTIKLS